MKNKIIAWIDILVESINYIVINYALSNMTMLFRHDFLFILFFASEIWTMENYWRKIYGITKSKVCSMILLIVCFLIHIGLIYVGNLKL